MADWNMIGNLSKRYESNGEPGATGFDAVGGWSYGLYQIAANPGTLGLFLAWLQGANSSASDRLQRAGGAVAGKAGAVSFHQAWKELASGDPEFVQNQHDFIKATHYDVQAARVKAAGVDPDQRSGVLRDVIWSTAVQHGAKTNVITGVIAEYGAVPDSQLIPLIYAERRTRFGSSTPAIQKSVMRRFDSEQCEALRMLRETKTSFEAPAPAPAPARSAETIPGSTKPTVEHQQSTNKRSNYL
jgi:hypothetical protein